MAAARGPFDGTGVAADAPGARFAAEYVPPRARAPRDFSAVRGELGLSAEFPAPALGEAERAAASSPGGARRCDATDLPLVTVDPPGARDLDQAVLLERRGRGGFRVHYAIADVAAFVRPGGALDRETRRRGQTLYLPDGNIPLHPRVLSEDAGSLLPNRVRPAVLWRIDLAEDGAVEDFDARRALVRSTAMLDYRGVQRSLRAGRPHPAVALLPEVGRLRRRQAMLRGAIELGLPEQQVEPDGTGGWRPALRPRTEVEEWNAEISLLTGMCAAELMLSAEVGVLRTVPEPDADTVAALRRSAWELGVDWPEHVPVATALAELDTARPEALAVHVAATRLLRGAGYTAFDEELPRKATHAGIGAAYAHVTAPLRRLVDRYSAEVCLAVLAGRPVPSWAREALGDLPSAMGSSDRVATRVERACIAQAQAWSLAGRVGDAFPATVLRVPNGEAGEVFVTDPPVIARCTGSGLSEGQHVRVRLAAADPAERDVAFELA
ncbi:RNB domain-containing ribonuclease [Salinifilum ghardaiensis]